MSETNVTSYINLIKEHSIGIEVLKKGKENMQISLLSYDSRNAGKGDIFFCKGRNFKADYLSAAIKKEVSVVCFQDLTNDCKSLLDDHPELAVWRVSDINKTMAVCAAHRYGYPLKKLTTVAVTGTKGKTTTVQMIKNSLNEAFGIKASILSDMVQGATSTLTTPEAIDVHKAAAFALEQGVTHLICEVSSQGMRYARCYGIEFDISCFLNFGNDHISPNEHNDISDYFLSKAAILLMSKKTFISADCERYTELLRIISNAPVKNICEGSLLEKEYELLNKLCLFPLNNKPKIISFGRINTCDYGGSLSKHGMINVREPSGENVDLCLTLPSSINIGNALAAYAVSRELGCTPDEVFRGILKTHPDGRYEEVRSADGKITVIVDYAHNKMSFEAIFDDTEKRFKNIPLTAIFGCPGGKAFNRRKELTETALKYADRIIITEDDSSDEEFSAITDTMLEESKAFHHPSISIIKDRSAAVENAVMNALENRESRVILFLGKGTESSMKCSDGEKFCESDLVRSKKAIDKYNSRISITNLFSDISKRQGEKLCVCICKNENALDNFAESVAILLSSGIELTAVCETDSFSYLRDTCYKNGVILYKIDLNTHIGNEVHHPPYVKVLTVNENLEENGMRYALDVKADSLVYLTCSGGILLNGNNISSDISFDYMKNVMLHTKSPYLREINTALENGVKECAVIDGNQRYGIALFCYGKGYSGSVIKKHT